MAKLDSNLNPLGRSRANRSGQGGTADWQSATATLVRDAICSAARAGGALRFGYSRDQGAYSIGVYGDGEYYAVYVGPKDDIDITLRDLIDLFDDMNSASVMVPVGS